MAIEPRSDGDLLTPERSESAAVGFAGSCSSSFCAWCVSVSSPDPLGLGSMRVSNSATFRIG
jgi:hypothetical protein